MVGPNTYVRNVEEVVYANTVELNQNAENAEDRYSVYTERENAYAKIVVEKTYANMVK